MNRFSRIVRHLCTTGAAARRAFPASTLTKLKDAIGTGELRHRAQIRLVIEPGLDLSDLLENLSSRGRAHALFSLYRVWDTEENCGVLVYINMADRTVEIVTDRGVGRLVERADWEAVCNTMTQAFKQAKFDEGALAGVAQANALLQKHFPAIDGAGRNNELSDRPVIL